MATNSWWIHQVILTLLFLSWRDYVHCSGLTVDPPEDLVILDPGHLGELDITWKPPASLISVTECSTLYQLEYFNTYRNDWTAIRTSRRSYTAQFDLMKDIRVRVYTLLSGPCTNGSMIKSTNYIELVQKPPSTGIVDTAVQDFVCLFHNMDYMECNWGRSSKMPANSQHTLYIWHKELSEAVECPKYIISGGVRSGCNFTGNILPDFIDIIFCVNGSSDEGPLKPTFTSLQIQNQVKPGTTEKLHLQTGPDRQLEIQWEHPVGRIPGLCLEWEVEHNEEGPDGKITSKQFFTKQTSLTLPSIHDKWRNCFRVRSKVNKYCAAKGFWSEWSRPACHTEVTAEAEWDMVPAYLYITTAILAILVLSLCVWAMLKVRGSRQDKKPDSLLTSLFARNSVLTVADA
ncbi:interleukin-13 receptor subunit alpha-2 isoform X1 [Mastacembelus armatus]|uniref:interleukin-13 receptor subunit alpha-2 isoform X1 n=1 Tax=Mastacembelus armatus TaxID=205130 RepID=UPI000E45D64F|nr:interleukin-13 receptor subunit alpha-2 isoform X1 [Mastacembelus armatus]XP_026185017.1 interleukin-13 receptor subunit alpha-2 isoform X1 [Mastacembelus armatus]